MRNWLPGAPSPGRAVTDTPQPLEPGTKGMITDRGQVVGGQACSGPPRDPPRRKRCSWGQTGRADLERKPAGQNRPWAPHGGSCWWTARSRSWTEAQADHGGPWSLPRGPPLQLIPRCPQQVRLTPASVLLTRRRHGEGSPHDKGQYSWSWFSPSEDLHPGPLPHRADMGDTGGSQGRGRTDNLPCPVSGAPPGVWKQEHPSERSPALPSVEGGPESRPPMTLPRCGSRRHAAVLVGDSRQ